MKRPIRRNDFFEETATPQRSLPQRKTYTQINQHKKYQKSLKSPIRLNDLFGETSILHNGMASVKHLKQEIIQMGNPMF